MAFALGVEPHDRRHQLCRFRRQPLQQRSPGDQHARAGIAEHEGEAPRRVVRVERQIGAPSLEDGEHRHDHLGRARKAQPHHCLGPYAKRTQVTRQRAADANPLRACRRNLRHCQPGYGKYVDRLEHRLADGPDFRSAPQPGCVENVSTDRLVRLQPLDGVLEVRIASIWFSARAVSMKGKSRAWAASAAACSRSTA